LGAIMGGSGSANWAYLSTGVCGAPTRLFARRSRYMADTCGAGHTEARGENGYLLPRPAGATRPTGVAHGDGGAGAGGGGAGSRPKLPDKISAARSSSAPSPMSTAFRFPSGLTTTGCEASREDPASRRLSAHAVGDLPQPRAVRGFGAAIPDRASAALLGARTEGGAAPFPAPSFLGGMSGGVCPGHQPCDVAQIVL